MKSLINADFINCSNCLFSEISPEPNDFTRFRRLCNRDKGFIHTVQEKSYCEYWISRQQTAIPPEYQDGCKFPHCPNCNDDLDICMSPDDSADGYYIQGNYCHFCGQKIKWEESK